MWCSIDPDEVRECAFCCARQSKVIIEQGQRLVSRVEAIQRNPLLNSGNGSYSCESITQIHKVKPANDKMNSQKNLLPIWGIKACGTALLL